LSCSLVSNKRFNAACEAYRSLAREISDARRRIQEAIAHLDVLKRKWEHSVEHGLLRNCQSKVTFSCDLLLSMNVANILSQALSSLELSGPSAIDYSQDSSFVAEDLPEGNTSSTIDCSQDSSFAAEDLSEENTSDDEDLSEGNTSSFPSNSIPSIV
jgi:hypothetical protein